MPVWLIADNDTIKTNSDIKGRFTFHGIDKIHIALIINGLNYQGIKNSYDISQQPQNFILQPIVLKEKTVLLKEVVIKAKPKIIVFKKDTVEYSAGAFQRYQEDLLEDLLKRLPGVRIDKDGNVTQEGKTIIRFRVNGQDFFSGNLKDFLKQLPAGIIDKLQIINDYGDEANFTGIKIGEPAKMLNLVIKNGMNHGKFGDAGISAGTNKQYGISSHNNYWRDTTQISVGAILNNMKNSNGKYNTNSATISYRNKFKHKLVFSGSYSYSGDNFNADVNSYSENILNSGSIFTNANSHIDQKNKSNSLNMSLDYRPDKNNYVTISPIITFASVTNFSKQASVQTGSIRQDLNQQNVLNARAPSFSGTVSIGHHFAKPGHVATLNFSLRNNQNKNETGIIDSIGYYNNNEHVKDSLVHRLVTDRVINKEVSIKLAYANPINAHSNIDFLYTFNQNRQKSNVVTNIEGIDGIFNEIDSLSNAYQSTFTTHTLKLAYRYNNDKLQLTGGYSFQPAFLTGQSSGIAGAVQKNTYNFAPVLNAEYLISEKSTLALNFNSTNTAPTYYQLNPVKDTRNIQNVIVGNPNLKSTFDNQYSLTFRHNTAGGSFLSLKLGGSTIKNKIVTNTILQLDTLNNLRKETHYINTGGSYALNGEYYFSTSMVAFHQQKIYLSISGNTGYANNPTFSDSRRLDNTSFNLSQSASFSTNIRRLDILLSSTYSYSKNQFVTTDGISSTFRTVQFGLVSGYFITPDLVLNIAGYKNLNKGYNSSLALNPLIVNASVKQKIFKRKTGEIQLEAFDLFNQNNGLNRTITDNTITESRIKYITQYVKLTVSIRLSKFGESDKH